MSFENNQMLKTVKYSFVGRKSIFFLFLNYVFSYCKYCYVPIYQNYTLLIIPFLTSKYRLCSIPLIELAGNDIFDDFHFLTTDNTFDKALQTSFGSVFYDKLTEKKELEVLKGKYKDYSFTTYDFKASNQSISSIQSRMEGTLIRIRFNTGVLKPSYATTNNLSDFFLPLEKLSIGGDGMTYFGDSKDDLNNHIDIKKIKDLDQLTILSIDQNGISVLSRSRQFRSTAKNMRNW